MASIFYAVYDDSTKAVPFMIVHRNPITIYRTANMELIENISAMGFDPKAVLLEEDIESLVNGDYQNDEIPADELEFLVNTSKQWALKST
ncbi:MAG: hypothetical protein R3Y63_02335 [Eubacteriales bacterium]